MDRWDKLSMRDKSELMKIFVKNGVTDINNIKTQYNSFGDGGVLETGKKLYNTYIRPKISNTFDATKYKDFGSAYNAARSNGNKTFVWNGEHYNTNYSGEYHKKYEEDIKSGKAKAWEQQYPNYTNPNLRKAKQEELDTYGITNEQTRDKNTIENNITNSLDYFGYQPTKIIPALFNIKNNERILADEVNASSNDIKSPYINYFKNSLDINKDGFKKAIKSLDGKDIKQFEQDKIRYEDRSDLFSFLMGNAVKNDGISISEYRPTDAEHDYYIKLNNNSERLTTSNLEHAKQEEQEIIQKLQIKNLPRSRKRALTKSLEKIQPYLDESKENRLVKGDVQLGDYTVAVTDDFNSYYDLWDINPLGQGNIPNLIGTPINIYDRRYKTQAPKIDDLYINLKYDKNK